MPWENLVDLVSGLHSILTIQPTSGCLPNIVTDIAGEWSVGAVDLLALTAKTRSTCSPPILNLHNTCSRQSAKLKYHRIFLLCGSYHKSEIFVKIFLYSCKGMKISLT